MLENLFNHTRVLYESNDPHNTGTLWADEGICLVDFLYQPDPVSPERLVGQFWFKDAGDRLSILLSDQINLLKINEIVDKRGVVLGLRTTFLMAKKWF